MKYGMYCLRDLYTTFGTPFCHANENSAKRYFARLVNTTDGDVSFSPRDYDLFHIADFDDSNGIISVVTPAEFICNGADMIGVMKNAE